MRSEPAPSSPISSAPHPFWNTAVSTPYEAATDSRFINAEVSGTTIDRNAIISSRNARPTTIAITDGSLSEIFVARSM